MTAISPRTDVGRGAARSRRFVVERVVRRAAIALLAVLVALNAGELHRRLRFWFTGAVRVDGLTFYLNSADEFLTQHVLERGIWEPEETQLILEQLRRGDTVIDVGANIGWYTILASRAVGDDGLVIAFEPDPTNFELLKRNVESNGCRNVRLEQKALSNKPGSVTLFLHESNKGMHSLLSFKESEGSIDVEAVSLYDYLSANTRRIDFVKIDVEGAEAFVLEGMRKTLAANPDMSLLLEFVPERFVAAGYDPQSILSQLECGGFHFHEVATSGGLETRVGIQDLLRRVNSQERLYTNLFVCGNGECATGDSGSL
jgi:FkbM family methyltransferase